MADLINQFFGSGRSVVQCSAPGRLDVMGGIADYSGSLLLQMPIRQRTRVSLAPRPDQVLRIRSTTAQQAGFPCEITIPVDFLLKYGHSYSEFRKALLQEPAGDWAIYVAGCFYQLITSKSFSFTGADVLVESEVPFGKGVSSSAAIETATLMAISETYKLNLGRVELPILAQQIENLIVGAPCGLMDQLSSYLGEDNKLLPIICQPVEVFPPLTIPAGIQFIGMDSGVKHAVTGNSYTNVRIAAFMGYSIIAKSLGAQPHELENARRTGNWSNLPFGGYLANIPVDVFVKSYLTLLPEKLEGAAFLKMFGFTIDAVTEVDPNTVYEVRACTSHPIYENNRVNLFKQYLEDLGSANGSTVSEDILIKLGQLMYDSHLSYSACGLGHEQTDELVSMVKEAGSQKGLYGAKITGGGSGGTVCVLTYGANGLEAARQLFTAYCTKYNLDLQFFEGSSPGGFYSKPTYLST